MKQLKEEKEKMLGIGSGAQTKLSASEIQEMREKNELLENEKKKTSS